MTRRILRRPKHATVVAYLALFSALGGTGYAAAKLPNNSVTSATIRNRSVKLQDLAPNVRPVKANRAFRAAVVDTVTDPASNLTITVKSEKGDPGAPSFVPGPPGAPGDPGVGLPGPTGPRGSALGFVHVLTPFSIDAAHSTPNIAVTKPTGTSGLYCLSATDTPAENAAVSLDANDSLTAVPFLRVPAAGSACAGADLELTVVQNGAAGPVAVDHAFFATLS